MNLSRCPTCPEIRAFFLEAKRRLDMSHYSLVEFNRDWSNGHILGEGELQYFPDAFDMMDGYVRDSLAKLNSLDLDLDSEEQQERFAKHFQDNANTAGCLDQMIDAVQSFFVTRMEPRDLPVFVLRLVDEMLRSMDTHPGLTACAFTSDQILANRILPELKRTPAPPSTDWNRVLDMVSEHIDERLEQWMTSHPNRERQVQALRAELKRRRARSHKR